MKINTIYNCIVLFFLHAFCLLLCFQIEDFYSVDLSMATIFGGSTYWELFLRMLYLSPFIMYYFFKKREDTESTNFDKVFGLIFGIILLVIVMSQLIYCSYRIIKFELPLNPGLLCVGVNILSLILYYLWNYNQQNFLTSERTNLVKICNLFLVITMLIYGFIVSNTYTPFKYLQLLHNDQQLDNVIYKIENLDKVYNNINEVIETFSNKKQKKNAIKFSENKHLIYKKINKNQYKISWKTHLNKKQKDNIVRSGMYVSDNLYDKNEKIIDIEERDKKKNKIAINTETGPRPTEEEEKQAKKLIEKTISNEEKTKKMVEEGKIFDVTKS